jgi:hypothetical protein
MSTFFKIQPHEPRTLRWWNNRRDQIDFDPPYQRKGGLWSPQDKAYLIDSILNGFDVPKLYLADYQYGESNLNVAKLPYAIIDGKQRLEAIFDFFDNKIALDEKFIWRKEPSATLGGLSFKDLYFKYPSVAEEFENSNLTIMSVYTDDETLINELFVRLNRSKALTGAEVRNAMPGKVPDAIREIAKHVVFREIVRFSAKRAGDSNAAAKILLFEYIQEPGSTKKKDLDHFAKGKEVNATKLELAARRSIDTLDEMRDVFLPNDILLASAGVFPVYYWLVRSVDPLFHGEIRPFLIQFEERRARNRDLQKSNPHSAKVNEELLRYDTLNRSTNDAGSHKGRISILLDQLRYHISISKFGSDLAKANLIRSI